jgi:sulfide:quinone oxidoreductase
MESPIPVSPETSEAIVRALGERDIGYTPSRRVRELDPTAHVAQLRTGDIPYDLFIGIPVHRAPAVVAASGLTVGGTDGCVAVDPRNLATRFPNVYALGDCADAPVPRAGVFAETAARAVADHIAAKIHGSGVVKPYDGTGSCYIEFGAGLVGRSTPTSCLGRRRRRRSSARRQSWPRRRNGSPRPDAGAGSARDSEGRWCR